MIFGAHLNYDHVQMKHSLCRVVKSTENRKFYSIWSEMKQCADLEFRFQEKSDAYSLAPALANNLNFYPEHHAVSVGSMFDDIVDSDVEQIREYMNIIQPEKSVIFLRNQVLYLLFSYADK